MGDKSKIEWTDATWNPVTGCTRVSQGCRNCYMARTVPRFGQDPWKVVIHPDRLDHPLRRKKPRRIFVNSLSDLFHEDVPDRFIEKVYGVMCNASCHTYQVLTKRPKRMLDWISRSAYLANDPPKHIWLGVSVENQATADERIPLLLQTPAAVRFVSAEPLLRPFSFRWAKWGNRMLDWGIVGGESGTGARPMHPDWARSIRDQCKVAEVSFFFKQWGEWMPSGQMTEIQKDDMVEKFAGKPPMIENDGVEQDGHFYRIGKKAAGSMLDGREWREFPTP